MADLSRGYPPCDGSALPARQPRSAVNEPSHGIATSTVSPPSRISAAERDERALQRLAGEQYDVVVVGGGVHGAFAAWQAARWGWKVALLERDDFASGTSANSLKIAHGGLRYLQTMDLPRLRTSARERAALLSLAPALVRPLPCVLPTRGSGMRSRAALAMALRANDILSTGATGELNARLPRGVTIGTEEYRSLAGELAVPGATGAALWYDGLMQSPERLVLAIVLAAEREGATVLNHAEVVSAIETHGRVSGVRVLHRTHESSGEQHEAFTVQASVVLLTSGPWVSGLATGAGTDMVRACNVVFDFDSDMLPHVAAALPLEREHRMLFAVPWNGHLMVGTSYSLVRPGSSPDALLAESESDISALVDDIAKAAPSLGVRRDWVTMAHVGLLPGAAGRHGAGPLDRPVLVDHGAAGGVNGLVSLQGVKWTTARMAAREALELCATAGSLDRPVAARDVAEPQDVLVPEADATDLAGRVAFLPGRAERGGGQAGRIATRLSRLRGANASEVLTLASSEPELAGVLNGGDVLAAEVAHSVRREHARTLSDIVLRRLELGTAGPPDAALLEAVSRVAAAELGWSEERRQSEVTLVSAAAPYRFSASGTG